MILDSNIIIYAYKIENQNLRNFIRRNGPVVSIISYVETLGFHHISKDEKEYLTQFFHSTEVLPLTDNIAQKAVELRQKRSISLGDSLIAATAIAHNLTLITSNTDDFKWIEGFKQIDPMSKTTH